MKIYTIDFETFYSKDYSLTKMTTEEYIRGDLFEVIGVGIQEQDGEPVWFSGTRLEIKNFLKQFDLENNLVLAHNAMFDAGILCWHFNIFPHGWLDTLSMARALHGSEVGGSLKALVQYYGVGVKGDEVINAMGKTRADFTPEQLHTYGEYCRNDVAITYALFCAMSDFPKSELRLIDLTIKMFAEPVLILDVDTLEQHKAELLSAKERLMGLIAADQETLNSNIKFAALLAQHGVEPPTKISLTTGKLTYAFAKTDEGLKALLEHDSPMVQAVVAARLGTKSTLAESRVQRFIDIAKRGPMPVPLRYYAAHTGRWGGDDKINLQNLPRTGELKRAICAPAGYKIIDSDSSQIEARTLAWLAEQDDLVQAFEDGQDVYKIMASAIYNKPESTITKPQRFVGKTTILGCLAEGTLVLCERGWVPIEKVAAHDRVWDGEGWVCHQGLVNSGIKETLNLCGVWLTPDHRVWSGTHWLEAQSVVADKNTLCQVLDSGAENLPSLGTLQQYGVEFPQLSLTVPAGYLSTPSIGVTSGTSKALVVTYVLRSLPILLANYIGGMPKYCPMMSTGNGYLTGFPLQFLDATPPHVGISTTTVAGALRYAKSGEQTGLSFLGTCRPLLGGIVQIWRWIGQTLTGGTSRGTSGLSLEVKTSRTNAKSKTLRQKLQTYDLAYCGLRNRYTVLTDKGPMIVHNCGYGMGADKFQAQLAAMDVIIELEEAQRIISVYRKTYPKIVKLWADAQSALKAMMSNMTYPLGRANALGVDGEQGILLPNGLRLKYPNLRVKAADEYTRNTEFVYDTKRGKNSMETKIYGGKAVENICQALARIIIGEQMLMIARKYRVVMTVHDAIASIVPEKEVHTAREYVEMCMKIRPAWALQLPLNCESGSGDNYGEC